MKQVTAAALVALAFAPVALADHSPGKKKGHGKKGTPGYVPPVKKQSKVKVPKQPRAQSASGDYVAAGSFHIQFTAKRPKGGQATDATGTFTGTLQGLGAQFAGPVTCLSVVGNDVGLFYPVTSTVPPGGEAAKLGVFIYVLTDGHGHATQGGFVPVPTQTVTSCDPVPAMETMPAEGMATAKGGKQAQG